MNMDTYHAAYWSDPSDSSSEEEDNRYNDAILAQGPPMVAPLPSHVKSID